METVIVELIEMIRELTQLDHLKYVHLCGKTGRQIEESDICESCDKIFECLGTHVVVGWDAGVTIAG